MPINPIVGRCSPVRPDVHIRLIDGVVEGTAFLSKRFTGPPGFCHGGIGAMLAVEASAELAPYQRLVERNPRRG